ncbi:MAG TPA: NADH-quinone oxidoreductase subunit NuoG [Terriglobales bacterium]|nr:NADH-quinone oxidoreductase subunit NuoG [Terriglobales bacterium]
MATVYIDGKTYPADPAQNMLFTSLTLGFNLPYFCWHPAMGSVGACRQCAVKQFRDENDTHGKLVMACMTPAAEGTRISIHDPEAVKFRAGVIEGLMLNHPHDCPVCDEGGECHLQDMTLMTGHDYRRYPYEKRTFRNQYMGPLVNQEMNRCIQCYRCVRFYREYAGGDDFNSFVLRNLVFFGRHKDGVLESEFSGNLVEVCPTGVFTDKTLKQHYTRKWDLQFAPSICAHCGLGCNTSPGERYGMLRRIVNRYNGEVNGYFLCDRGRYGYEFVNSSQRIRQPLLRREGVAQPVSRDQALQAARELLAGKQNLIGIGSPRASLEANFALCTLVGPEHFFAGMADEEYRLVAKMIGILRTTPVRTPSLREMEQSDAVLLLGEDPTNFAPRLALALRQSIRQQPFTATDKLKIPRWLDHAVREAVQDDKGPLFIASPYATRLDDIAARTFRGAPDDIARLGFAVARALDQGAPATSMSGDAVTLATQIAQALKGAQRPLVVGGGGLNSEAILDAAANVARALHATGKDARLSFTVPECNSMGLALMGANPLSAALAAVKDADTVIVLENDLQRRLPTPVLREFWEQAFHVIALDCLGNSTTERAELTLPAGTFAESDGTLVSSEGRAQRFFQVFVPQGDIQESWRWLRDLAAVCGREEMAAWQELDDVIVALSNAIPELAGIVNAAPFSGLRLAGEKVPREPHRYSGRTAMLANINVSEPKPPDDPDSPLSFSMEGYPDQPPSALIPFFWSPGWNSIQATNFYQKEIAGRLRGGDPGARLIEPVAAQSEGYCVRVPPAFTARENESLLVPAYHIFGSEEQSMQSPAIAELAPQPYVALNANDAARLALRPESLAEVKLDGASYRVQVRIRPDVPSGVAALLVGIPPVVGVRLPAWGVVQPAEVPGGGGPERAA